MLQADITDFQAIIMCICSVQGAASTKVASLLGVVLQTANRGMRDRVTVT